MALAPDATFAHLSPLKEWDVPVSFSRLLLPENVKSPDPIPFYWWPDLDKGWSLCEKRIGGSGIIGTPGAGTPSGTGTSSGTGTLSVAGMPPGTTAPGTTAPAMTAPAMTAPVVGAAEEGTARARRSARSKSRAAAAAPTSVPQDESATARALLQRCSTTPFLQKLWNMLDDPRNKDTLRWHASGAAFEIIDRRRMQSHVLPQHFRHANLCSFQRQLNYFGFSRDGAKSRLLYMHEHFHRDRPQDAVLIRRRTNRGGAKGHHVHRYFGRRLQAYAKPATIATGSCTCDDHAQPPGRVADSPRRAARLPRMAPTSSTL